MTIKTYQLLTYDVWGNAREGWEVNDIHPAMQGESILSANYVHLFLSGDMIRNRIINRMLKLRGINWVEDWDSEKGLIIGTYKNGKPFGELREIEG